MFSTPVICSGVCDNSEGLICRAREAQVERRSWVMIPQRVIRAVQEPSLPYHKHRQSQDSLLIAFSSVQEKEGGEDGGREETFFLPQSTLFQQIMPSSPDRERDEREQEEECVFLSLKSSLLFLPPSACISEKESKGLKLIIMLKYSIDSRQ